MPLELISPLEIILDIIHFSREVWNDVTQAILGRSKWENMTLVDWLLDQLYYKAITTYKALACLLAYGIWGTQNHMIFQDFVIMSSEIARKVRIA